MEIHKNENVRVPRRFARKFYQYLGIDIRKCRYETRHGYLREYRINQSIRSVPFRAYMGWLSSASVAAYCNEGRIQEQINALFEAINNANYTPLNETI